MSIKQFLKNLFKPKVKDIPVPHGPKIDFSRPWSEDKDFIYGFDEYGNRVFVEKAGEI